MKAAVIGLGFGRFHAAELARIPDVELVALCQSHEPDPPLDRLADLYGARGYRTVDDMLAHEALDLVCICSRPSNHAAMVRSVADANVAMLIEKPVAGSEFDARGIASVVKSTGAWAAVNFEMRWLPPVQRLRGLLLNGYFGRPLLLELSYVIDSVPSGSWVWRAEEGGSPIWENTCHAYDLVRYLLGDMEVVGSTARNLLGVGAPSPDCALVTMANAAGALAVVIGGAIGTRERAAPIRLNLYGTDGYATVSGQFHTFTTIGYARTGARVTVEDGSRSMQDDATGRLAVEMLLGNGLKRVVADLAAGRPPSASVEDALAVAEICAQVLRLREGD
jgi:predicted dehydrogenase